MAICFAAVNNLDVEVSQMKKTPLEAEPLLSRRIIQMAIYAFILGPRVFAWALIYSYGR